MKKLFPIVLLFVIAFEGCSKKDDMDVHTASPAAPVTPVVSATTTPAPLAASFRILNQSNVREGTAINFINTSTGAKFYKWDFGNGITIKEKDPSYTYPSCGIYDVTLIVTDENGTEQRSTVQLTVNCVFTGTGFPSQHAPLF